jgi:UDP-N-acetylglucosamine diphosphorylase/glucosamine-1-phosphate N-acetyltransferase
MGFSIFIPMERNYILFDTPARELLYPFTHTRPVAACRVGILTIREKWEHWLNTSVSYLTVPHLQEKYPLCQKETWENVFIDGSVLPAADLVEAIKALKAGQHLYKDHQLIAYILEKNDSQREIYVSGEAAAKQRPSSEQATNKKKVGEDEKKVEKLHFDGPVAFITMPWDIFLLNDQAIRDDFDLLTQHRTSAAIPDSNQVIAPENIFIEEGAVVACSILNASTGPIYIGKQAVIMEGCLVRGPLALGEKAVLKMGTKVYGATTLGPGSVGGGEMKNVVMFGYSNKGHDGYLGDAVLGEWCNLGANTTCSNLKNNGSLVKVWVEASKEGQVAGRKCGLLMGDYSRCGVGTMLNTGTVIGVSCNIFGGDFPPKFVPSFSWGGAVKLEDYRLEEALRDAATWMEFKGQHLSPVEERLLQSVFTSVNNL